MNVDEILTLDNNPGLVINLSLLPDMFSPEWSADYVGSLISVLDMRLKGIICTHGQFSALVRLQDQVELIVNLIGFKRVEALIKITDVFQKGASRVIIGSVFLESCRILSEGMAEIQRAISQGMKKTLH